MPAQAWHGASREVAHRSGLELCEGTGESGHGTFFRGGGQQGFPAGNNVGPIQRSDSPSHGNESKLLLISELLPSSLNIPLMPCLHEAKIFIPHCGVLYRLHTTVYMHTGGLRTPQLSHASWRIVIVSPEYLLDHNGRLP